MQTLRITSNKTRVGVSDLRKEKSNWSEYVDSDAYVRMLLNAGWIQTV